MQNTGGRQQGVKERKKKKKPTPTQMRRGQDNHEISFFLNHPTQSLGGWVVATVVPLAHRFPLLCPLVIVPSCCSPFPPCEQLLAAAVGGAVVVVVPPRCPLSLVVVPCPSSLSPLPCQSRYTAPSIHPMSRGL